MPTLRDRDMGTIIKRPIANGVYLRPERPDGSFMGDPWDRAQRMPLRELLRELAGDMSLIEFALRFTLSHEDVCTAIVGSTNMDHLAENVKISDGKALPEDVLENTKRVFQSLFG